LDEIGNLPLSGQVKLLRVLESGQFEPLGSSRTRSTRVRVISATNAELPQMIRQGVFREDLYYRLNTIEIPLPALAARPADILPLAQHFLGPELTLGDDARQALLRHAWPGNVRELRNVLERARLLVGRGEVKAADLNLPAPKAQSASEEEALNRTAIEASLRAAGGNISRAAASLGLSRQALYRRMERLGMRS
jgi:DNA-binding NtrC family response regulator